MRKIAAITSSISYLVFSASNAFAQNVPSITSGNIGIAKPGFGYSDINDFINAAIRLAFIIAIIAVLAMLVWGAIEWIFSGGNKDAVKSARERIIHALVGLAILAVAFAIATFAGRFVGIDIFQPGGFVVPKPASPAPDFRSP